MLSALSKDNQDCYTVIPAFQNLKDCSFFGVYDGHGKEGHLCARYVRDHVSTAHDYLFNNQRNISQHPVASSC
jgi:serine/threonine protein phosphatase PrpC